jgi:hypothetical protein
MKKKKSSLRKRARPAQADRKHVAERRKALKAIGKLAIYTPPAMMALLKSARANGCAGSGVP